MKVSIIIPHHNGIGLIKSCIDSIKLQTYSNYDITVIDNSSHDDSLEYLIKVSNGFQLIKLKENYGFSKAVNEGIKASDGDLILVLNNDTVLKPNCLEAIIKGINTHPNYSSYALKIIDYYDHSSIYATGLMFSTKGYGNRSQRHLLKFIDEPVEVFAACGAAAIYRRNILEKVGNFNEDYFILNEDLELGFRHQLHGYKCLYLPSAELFHHGSATIRKNFSCAVKESIKNSLQTLITCVPSEIVIENLWIIAKFYASFWIIVLKKGFWREFLQAIITIVRRLPIILRKRKIIQNEAVNLDIKALKTLLFDGKIEINFLDETIIL